MSDDQTLLSDYQRQNPADFIILEMLGDVKRLKKAMDETELTYSRELDPKKQLKQVAELAKLQKQHLETLKVIAKFQETTYSTAIKARRANKSAAPGQRVGQALSSNESTTAALASDLTTVQ